MVRRTNTTSAKGGCKEVATRGRKHGPSQGFNGLHHGRTGAVRKGKAAMCSLATERTKESLPKLRATRGCPGREPCHSKCSGESWKRLLEGTWSRRQSLK